MHLISLKSAQLILDLDDIMSILFDKALQSYQIRFKSVRDKTHYIEFKNPEIFKEIENQIKRNYFPEDLTQDSPTKTETPILVN